MLTEEDLRAIETLEPEDIKDYFNRLEGLSDAVKQKVFNLIVEAKHEMIVEEFAAKAQED